MSFFVGFSPAGAVGVAPASTGFVGVTFPPTGDGVTPGGGVTVGVTVGVGVGVPNHSGGYVPPPPPPPPDRDGFVVPTSAMVLRLVTFTQT